MSGEITQIDACGIPRDRYRVFIKDVADAFFETNVKGDFLFFNDALCRIFGYAREEIHNRNFRRFMDEKNAEFAFSSFSNMFRTEKGVTDILWEITRRDGQKRILEINANILGNEKGEKIGFQGIARDVTEKVKAERALKASEKKLKQQVAASRRAEQRYRALLEFLQMPVFVSSMNNTVSYVNPAFEKVFGWALDELKGRKISFVPDEEREQTIREMKNLSREKRIFGFETKRLTKDGRILDIIADGAIFYDEKNQPAGQVITLRDVTHEKRISRSNQALFRIASAIHRFRGLDDRLEYITRQVQKLIAIEGASVILLDETAREFYFRVSAFEDAEASRKWKEIRFPADKGAAGQVYRTGKPLIVHDTSKSPYYFKQVDDKAGYNTRSMLDVPIQIQDRMIGVLCVVNKKEGVFDETDVELLSTIANMVALPIENARINEKLFQSYEEVKSLNQAKDRVIHHLSHELKTPLSVLAASSSILRKKYRGSQDQNLKKILDRADRNLTRILEMQYEIEDIIGQRDYKSYTMLSTLLDVCQDELEALVSDAAGSEDLTPRIRERIEEIFGPRHVVPEEIYPGPFLKDFYDSLRQRFAGRKCRMETRFDDTEAVLIPPEVLTKIAEGLIRNAIENTPDGGRILIRVKNGAEGPEFMVRDFGVGITKENQRLIFDNYFTAYETAQYASKKPYAFNAGGKGFDLIRIKIFSERYHFKLKMASKRCVYLENPHASCPGNVEACPHCNTEQGCVDTSGTTMTVQFLPADKSPLRNN
jgi:PAS domain S-box-containing protein